MGFLLRQVLKTLCCRNQWCYAVFWKIGCQNPKLLIWEECHYESMPCSVPPSVYGVESSGFVDRVQILINKMIIDNQVNVVGEGIVGRAAFTGNHQWILSNNYIRHAHPPEVSNDVHHQFSAGMQTIAVIPVLPHGVLQLGSPSSIMENIGFVNDVKSLILQVGCVPGALLSDDYATKLSTENIMSPLTRTIPASVNSSGICETSSMPDSCKQQSNISQASRLVGQLSYPPTKQVHDSTPATATTFQTPKMVHSLVKSPDNHCQPIDTSLMKLNLRVVGQLQNGAVGAEVIPSNPDAWLSRQASCNSRFNFNRQSDNGQMGVRQNSLRLPEQHNISDAGVYQLRTNGGLVYNSQKDSTPLVEGGCEVQREISSQKNPCLVPNPQESTDHLNHCREHLAGVGIRNAESTSKEVVHLSSQADQPSTSHHVPSRGSDAERMASKSHPMILIKEDDSLQAFSIPCARPSSGDDLFDVLGLDYKNKLLNAKCNDAIANELDANLHSLLKDTSVVMNIQDTGSEFYSLSNGISDSGLFSGMGTDHLLDAVVSGAQSHVKQSSDDNVSCGTTLTKISSSSVPSTTPTYGRGTRFDHVEEELFGLTKPLLKPGAPGSTSFKSASSKDDPGSCSQTSSIYGSQISSWVEQGRNLKRETSVSTAFSKKPDDTSKPNRKRLKPGENPRPRPKDRQMIQDRVKELREIVPNGAKCSIDALLERTIKHMLFLQSVTKHADKLKKTGESKILNQDGGVLLKDNFEGGATWAFEVGSQSMVCPIIVEDLNPPRQMLVEMLCEERGFFLEIADLIRGMGLTILKGVMEARNDKIWARFAVEANRDVTRMEIFMSLVRLLEQTMKCSASSSNSVDNNNLMIHHSFPQAASVPMTGTPSMLQ